MRAALISFAQWLDNTPLSWAVAGGYPWIWPAAETLHFMGLAVLFGTVGVLDLRILGIMKEVAIRPLQRFMPWGIAGFTVNLVTGFLFFSGDPFQYIRNPAFFWKMTCIGLAGLNVVAFYFTGLSRQVDAVGAGEEAPAGAKLVAAVSLLLWIGVTYCGRMLPFLGNAF